MTSGHLASVRITLNIADDILRELKRLARVRKRSLNRVTNDILRAGLKRETRGQSPGRYRQRVFDLGEPLVNLDHSLRIAAAIEDEETARRRDTGR